MNGGQHFFIGAASVGAGLYVIQNMGVPIADSTILGCAMIAGVGALAPDIDHPHATISSRIPKKLLSVGLYPLLIFLFLGLIFYITGGRNPSVFVQTLSESSLVQMALVIIILALVLMFLSAIASSVFGHRGATHSFIFTALATCIAVIICTLLKTPWWYGLIFGLGWLSHLPADAMTEMGLPSLLWPFSNSTATYEANLRSSKRQRRK
jgi:membrane-bound metal-dependent hydrolase YbcI (DUF457 family)